MTDGTLLFFGLHGWIVISCSAHALPDLAAISKALSAGCRLCGLWLDWLVLCVGCAHVDQKGDDWRADGSLSSVVLRTHAWSAHAIPLSPCKAFFLPPLAHVPVPLLHPPTCLEPLISCSHRRTVRLNTTGRLCSASPHGSGAPVTPQTYDQCCSTCPVTMIPKRLESCAVQNRTTAVPLRRRTHHPEHGAMEFPGASMTSRAACLKETALSRTFR